MRKLNVRCGGPRTCLILVFTDRFLMKCGFRLMQPISKLCMLSNLILSHLVKRAVDIETSGS